MSGLNVKFKINSETTGQQQWGEWLIIFPLSRLNLKFKIFSELLVTNNVGDQSFFHVQAKS